MLNYNKNSLNKLKAAEPILRRSAVFLACFVIASGIIGPRIISHGLVNKYGFQIYGGGGKSLLFGILGLMIIVSRKGHFPKLQSWKIINLVWLLAGALSLAFGYIAVDHLINHSHGLYWPLIAHFGILASIVFLLIFSFGLTNLHVIYKVYKKELLISLGITLAFFVFLYLVYGLWTILAAIVLKSVKGLLSLVGLQSTYLPPHSLALSKFTIAVSEFCSGVDSIALFTALYALFGVIDWNRFNHKKYLAVFVPALIILFCFNILRVFLLILGGYYINPQIAFSLFHTYAGMIFFILYSALFWSVSYKWMLNTSVSKNS